ncbi:HlyD family secretion protein [Sphingobacterium chungjuense]|uniref:HlyD family secretion protein n=1 Tax=Sphingobacterium chungjuense TaxID=2675553 RepID=UPI00140C489F|nr:HlyD family efflux transporter periplasmic adaptor subunit [Sphingobacterium chungjuense]
MDNSEEKLNDVYGRTEHVQEIITRIPTTFGLYVTGVVMFVLTLLLFFGWVVRYPDVIVGEIVINSNVSPIKLVAEVNGRLNLTLFESSDKVLEGEMLAYLRNAANPKNVYFIDSLLKRYNPFGEDILNLKKAMPQNFSIGELNEKYFIFLNSLEEFKNYREGRLLDKQHAALNRALVEQEEVIRVAQNRLDMGSNSLEHALRIYTRDSLLFLKKVISESELDNSKVSYNNSRESYQNNLNNLINARQQSMLTKGKIEEIEVQNPEKEQEIRSYVIASYNKLLDEIKLWEQKYVFKAPFDGQVQFLKFWNNNQFIQAGEEIFTVIPKDNQLVGEVMLPNKGAGKIAIGQEVIVKLDDYPYNEYGAIKGVVKAISLTTNVVRTTQGEINNYLVAVSFPEQLKTNYGSVLNFKYEAKGIAEIITNDRRLIERLFDNLKYRTN